ncbi:MAG: DNA polymerase III subunit gamma/tau [Gammaproteobacteria bacterium]|jgi:DNA polymerase-3 subunit gamma/tau|nr:DNA polymerase III subunit gamma/tau [Gammaproteobacteria bacterium]|tara:strand:+ start:2774 stop:4588 length:1815 start_codon:yes stop_codon:yes gene_type:complete
MSYQVLARKWRPSNFNEVAGQAHVLKSLVNALNNQRLHHAYLFTGTRGVGKTTLARILAKCLNCEKGIVSTPCGECGSCTEINEGRFIDLIEVDAASRTKVEDTRDLLDNVQYTPARGRFKVYLIDEVHMLSSHSFNALLKTLEEPPPHVKFLFATTDPQKLPVTILSRCLQFNLKNLSPQMIVEYLLGVLESEKIENEERALWQIAASAAGSMRDALTLVDQAISFCQGDITEDGVIEMLGIPEHRQIHSLLLSMASGNVTNVLALISEISEHTPDYSNVLDGLLSILHRIAIAQVVPAAVDNSFGDREQVQELARQISAEDVQLYYQMGIKGREDLNYSPEIRNAFEMLILRMMVFSPSYVHHDNQSLDSTDLDSVSANEASEQQPIDDSVGRDQSANKVAENVKKKTTKQTLDEEPDFKASSNGAAEAKLEQACEEPLKYENSSSDESATENTVAATSTIEVRPDQQAHSLESLNHQTWLEVYSQLNINGIASNIFANTVFEKAEKEHLHLILDESQSAVYSEDILPKLSHAISDYFNKSVAVHIQIGNAELETASLMSQRINQEKHSEMINEFEQDENVQELLKHFSGTLAKDSILPLKD